jgi:hypothetical protein
MYFFLATFADFLITGQGIPLLPPPSFAPLPPFFRPWWCSFACKPASLQASLSTHTQSLSHSIKYDLQNKRLQRYQKSPHTVLEISFRLGRVYTIGSFTTDQNWNLCLEFFRFSEFSSNAFRAVLCLIIASFLLIFGHGSVGTWLWYKS